MIDVVFLLMSYFLIVAEFRKPEAQLPVELVRSAAHAPPPADPFALPAPPIRLEVASAGDGPDDVAIRADSPLLRPPGGEAFTADGLTRTLKAALGYSLESDQRFIVAPVRGCRWEHAVAALDAVRQAGYSRIRLADPEGGR